MDEREWSIAHGNAINEDIAKRPEAYDNRTEIEQGISDLLDLVTTHRAETERLKALNAELVRSLRSVIETIDARSDDDRKQAVSRAIAIGMTALSKTESEAS